jgi:pilus assembly protein CpaF
MVDARLPDGSRVNAVIPPVAITGPALTIRKFGKVALTKEDLLARGTVTPEILAFLEACVKARLNIIVSGGTSSGKTTTLNVLASFIDPGERVITIEDTAELQMNLINRVGMESRPPNVEGQGEVTIRDMVRNALRMRPDRIIVGEVRGGEALDMLQAMLTGHQGSLSTVHSNSPRDTLHRMETMVMMAGLDLPSRSIQRQIASAIDLIIHQSRFQDGSRKITHITEIMGLDEEQIVLQDIFTFEQLVDKSGAVRGRYVPTGVVPRCINKMKFYNIELPDLSIFRPQKD